MFTNTLTAAPLRGDVDLYVKFLVRHVRQVHE